MISNPFKTMNKLKGIFKPLKTRYKISKYWYPILWLSKPAYIQIVIRDVCWKDKNYTPRYEVCPYIWLYLFGLSFIIYWEWKDNRLNDDYWEQALWYLYYSSEYKMKVPDIIEAEKYWPWVDMKTNKSSWNDNYLV